MNAPLDFLKKYWGLNSFRPLQEEIIRTVIDKRDTIALLPTGGGKSLCFQIPALMMEGVALVVSPLIALMNDQVNTLKQMGIRAGAIHSGLPFKTIERILDEACFGNLKILYVSPERLQSGDFQVRLGNMPVNLLVVDEAHCISQWGYDFRPAYRRIAVIREMHSRIPVVALTATATTQVVRDISDQLKLTNPALFIGNFLRPNLRFIVWSVEDKFHGLLQMVKKVRGPKIIYVRTRRRCNELQTFLSRRGHQCISYHAGIEKGRRTEIEESFLSDKVETIIATNAFGMGIDKPDVQLVLHFDVPEQLESYYQEAGRAGRDEAESLAVLLYQREDEDILFKLWEQNFPSTAFVRKVYRALGNYFSLATGAGEGQQLPFKLVEFCDRYQLNPLKSLNALKILEQSEWIILSEPTYYTSRVQCIVNPETLYDYQQRYPDKDPVVKALLRLYEGIFHGPVPVLEKRIANFLEIDEQILIQKLREIHQSGIIEYFPAVEGQSILFLRERVPYKNVTIDKDLLEFRKQRKKNAIRKMLEYVHTASCRQQFILEYLGCASPACGSCDVCRSGNRVTITSEEWVEIRDRIIELLQRNKLPVHQILGIFPEKSYESVTTVLQHLYEEEIISKSDEIVFLKNPHNDG